MGGHREHADDITDEHVEHKAEGVQPLLEGRSQPAEACPPDAIPRLVVVEALHADLLLRMQRTMVVRTSATMGLAVVSADASHPPWGKVGSQAGR